MMRIPSKAMQVFVLFFSGMFPWHSTLAQGPSAASLEDELKAQYKLTKTGSDSGGLSIVEPGTVFVIQKGGILGVPPNNATMGAAVYKDGELHSPGAGTRMFLGNSTRLLQIGEKVYALKLDVNVKSDKVSMTIMECDSCNGANQQSSYKSVVFFQFPKGYLSSADAGQVEDVIDQVFSIDKGNSGGQDPQNTLPPAQPAQQAPPTQPQTIQIGQTLDQVQAVLGQPDKIVNLGSKQIYVYKDIKVTFVNGKVTDAQ
ncbi:MAG TPA: hypothetical protein VEJ46_00900 [Candidatus Acidoferrum sp.]|nr:hypothetical protein [Candidatus Acidoferrum sp.]